MKDETPCVFIKYEIYYDEDRPCDFGFTWFELDHYPTEEERKYLSENGYNI